MAAMRVTREVKEEYKKQIINISKIKYIHIKDKIWNWTMTLYIGV